MFVARENKPSSSCAEEHIDRVVSEGTIEAVVPLLSKADGYLPG